MELERIGVALRPRESREALDLGAALLRANAGAVWQAWFAFTLPPFVLCNALGLLLGLPWLGLLLTWWLKPLFDRVPLYVLSRAVFDRAPRWRETLRGQRAMPWGPVVAARGWLRLEPRSMPAADTARCGPSIRAVPSAGLPPPPIRRRRGPVPRPIGRRCDRRR